MLFFVLLWCLFRAFSRAFLMLFLCFFSCFFGAFSRAFSRPFFFARKAQLRSLEERRKSATHLLCQWTFPEQASPAQPAGPSRTFTLLAGLPRASQPQPRFKKGLEKTRARSLARLCWLGHKSVPCRAPKQWTSGKGMKEKKVPPTYNGTIQFR